MSGPQGSDPTQPWPGQQPGQGTGDDVQSAGETAPGQNPWQPPAAGSEQPGAEGQQWQPPAYGQQPYPQYQQPGQPGYPGQQPEYNPAAFGQPGQPGQPGQFGPYGQQPGQYGAPPGYGQPTDQFGQPTGQFGQPPGQYGQYPQYGPPAADGGTKSSKTILAVVGGLLGLVLIAVLVLGFWQPGFFMTTKLDINAAQTGVQQILTDETNGYGAQNVRDVVCNEGNSPTVERNGSFTCDVSIDGTKRQVTVTFLDDDGTYEVGRPR